MISFQAYLRYDSGQPKYQSLDPQRHGFVRHHLTLFSKPVNAYYENRNLIQNGKRLLRKS